MVVKIDAIAASAASVIAMAGNKTYMSPVAMMMIHNPATMAIGQKSDMEKAIEMLDEVKEAIINAYELKSGMSRNKISRLMDSETWFNAKKALEMGFIDEILFDADKKEEEDEIPTYKLPKTILLIVLGLTGIHLLLKKMGKKRIKKTKTKKKTRMMTTRMSLTRLKRKKTKMMSQMKKTKTKKRKRKKS